VVWRALVRKLLQELLQFLVLLGAVEVEVLRGAELKPTEVRVQLFPLKEAQQRFRQAQAPEFLESRFTRHDGHDRFLDSRTIQLSSRLTREEP
jgi:hypothetical protein